MTASLIISIITLCLCVSGFFFFRWYIGRKTAASELLADYRSETYRLIAEIDAAADRDSLLVEERIKTLKKLLDDTDRRIAVYMKEMQRSRAGEQLYTSLGRGIRAALDSRPDQETPSQTELFSVQDSEKAPTPKETPTPTEMPTPKETLVPLKKHGSEMEPSAKTPTPKETPAPTETPTPKEMPSQKSRSGNNASRGGATEEAAVKRKPKKAKLKTQIAELSAQGIPPSKIASRLKLSLAEVDLALNLLQRPTGSQP